MSFVVTLGICFPSACNVVPLIGASNVLFMHSGHSISAMSLSVQSEVIQLCQELSVSACPVCISFIFIEKISCRVDLLILLMPTGMKPFDMRLM